MTNNPTPSLPEGPADGVTHTPGPWGYCGADRGGCSCMTVMCDDHPVATITSGDWGDEYPSVRLEGGSINRQAVAYMEKTVYGSVHEGVAKANARLIAAAPDLLSSLQAFLKMYLRGANSGDWGNWNPEEEPEIIAVRAAIAKATGASS